MLQVTKTFQRRHDMYGFPLEYALVEFEGNKYSGTIVPELLNMAERGIVRFVDIVFIAKMKMAAHNQSSWTNSTTICTSCSSHWAIRSIACSAKQTWTMKPANSLTIVPRLSSCGRTCGWRTSAKRSLIRGVCWSSVGKFPPKWSSRLGRTSPRKDKSTRCRTSKSTD